MIFVGLYFVFALLWTVIFDIFLDVDPPFNILPWLPLIWLGYGMYWMMEKFLKLIEFY